MLSVEVKGAVIAAWCVCSYLAYRGLAVVFARKRGGALQHGDLDAGSRLVSLCHGTFVIVSSLTTVLTSSPLDFTDANGLSPTFGTVGLCVSVAYFTYDLQVMKEIGFKQRAAMTAHHLLSGGCMFAIAFFVPRAVWYACLLQSTEITVPVNVLLHFLEHGPRGTVLYMAARWTQLGLWLTMRMLLFVYFGWRVRHDWDGLTTTMKAIGWGTGVPLAAFNTAGLFKVVLPGCPWLPRTTSKKANMYASRRVENPKAK